MLIVSGGRKTRWREKDDNQMRRATLVVADPKGVAQAQQHGDLWEPVQKGSGAAKTYTTRLQGMDRSRIGSLIAYG